MGLCRLRRPSSCPSSRSRGLEQRAAGWQSSGAGSVCCCWAISFSPARVSAPFIPHVGTPAQLPRGHLRAKIRSEHTLSRKRSHALSSSLPNVQIDARVDREVKLQTARRQVIDFLFDLFRERRGYRGRQGAPDASIDLSLVCARLWTCLSSAWSRLCRRLSCRFCRRLCGPALCGRWQSHPARARARRVASERAHAVALNRQGTRMLRMSGSGP